MDITTMRIIVTLAVVWLLHGHLLCGRMRAATGPGLKRQPNCLSEQE